MTFPYFLFPLKNYHFGKNKPPRNLIKIYSNFIEEYSLVKEHNNHETKIFVHALMLVTYHNTPHIILIKGPQRETYNLPGGLIEKGHSEVKGLIQVLEDQLLSKIHELKFDWEVCELLGVFHRPSHRSLILPYLPPYLSTAKEIIKIYAVQLPEKCVFTIHENQTILAVPIFDLYDNVTQWGNLISTIPIL